MVELEDPSERSRVCEPALRDLPEWFGIEEATAACIADVAELPTFAVGDDADPVESYARTGRFYDARGFVALEELHDLWEHNPCLLMVERLRCR
jgi:hypothetical protein